MSEPADFDPYQPPASAAVDIQPEGQAVLRDTRFIGKVALTAITVQVLIKFIVAVVDGAPELFAILGVVQVMAFLSSIVFFLVWLHQSASNVVRLNRHSEVTPGWAVGCYFIPIVHWVAPCLSMRAIIRGTFLRTPAGALQSLAVVWWLSYLVSNFIRRFGQDTLLFGAWFLTLTVSWISVIVLVTRISRRQAAFRWSEVPQPQLPLMTPLQARGTPQRPPLRPHRIGVPAPKPASEPNDTTATAKEV